MASKKRDSLATDQTTELLQDLIIIELGLAGVPQRDIRAIVGVDMKKVNKIVKLLPKNLSKSQREKE